MILLIDNREECPKSIRSFAVGDVVYLARSKSDYDNLLMSKFDMVI